MCVVSTMSGPPPEIIQDRTQTKDTHTPNPRSGIKIPDPAGNRTRVAVLESRDSADHATATDNCKLYNIKRGQKIILSTLNVIKTSIL